MSLLWVSRIYPVSQPFLGEGSSPDLRESMCGGEAVLSQAQRLFSETHLIGHCSAYLDQNDCRLSGRQPTAPHLYAVNACPLSFIVR